jgi:hypothetical protein
VEELEPPAERVEDARMAVDAALSGAPSTGG